MFESDCHCSGCVVVCMMYVMLKMSVCKCDCVIAVVVWLYDGCVIAFFLCDYPYSHFHHSKLIRERALSTWAKLVTVFWFKKFLFCLCQKLSHVGALPCDVCCVDV